MTNSRKMTSVKLSLIAATGVFSAAGYGLSFDNNRYGLELAYGQSSTELETLHQGSLSTSQASQINLLAQTSDYFEFGLGIRQSLYELSNDSGTTSTAKGLDGEIILRFLTPTLELGESSFQIFVGGSYIALSSQQLTYANSAMSAQVSNQARGEKDLFYANKQGSRLGGGMIYEYQRTYGLTAEYSRLQESWTAEIPVTAKEDSKGNLREKNSVGTLVTVGIRIKN